MSLFKAKMHQIRFRLGLRPRPRWGAYSAPPDPLARFKGPTSKGGEGKGGEWEGKGRGGGGEGMAGEGRRKGKGRGKGKGRKGPPRFGWHPPCSKSWKIPWVAVMSDLCLDNVTGFPSNSACSTSCACWSSTARRHLMSPNLSSWPPSQATELVWGRRSCCPSLCHALTRHSVT